MIDTGDMWRLIAVRANLIRCGHDDVVAEMDARPDRAGSILDAMFPEVGVLECGVGRSYDLLMRAISDGKARRARYD